MRLNFTFFFLFITTLLFAQMPKDLVSVEDEAFSDYYLNPETIPIVTGKILHLPENDYKKVSIQYTLVTPSRKFHETKTTDVSEDGSFTLKLDHGMPYQQIWLNLGPYYGTLYVKDGLKIAFDMEKLSNGRAEFYDDAITFSGADAALTTLMNKHITFKREKQLELSSAVQKLNRNRELTYPEYKSKYDSIHTILKDIDAQFLVENPSDYDPLIKNERLSGYYNDLLVKHWHKKMDDTLWNAIKNHKAYTVSNEGMLFYEYLFTYLKNYGNSDTTITIDDLLGMPDLSEVGKDAIEKSKTISEKAAAGKPFDTAEAKAVRKVVISLFKDFSDKMEDGTTAMIFKTIDSCFATPKADLLKLKMENNDPKEQGTIDIVALKSIQTPWCKEEIEDMAKKNQAKVDEIEATLKNATVSSTTASAFGKPAMEFDFGAKLYEIKDMNAQEVLAKIKSSFKNKALLLDFWAVWCGPCLGDFPYSKKLHDAVSDKPVEFIYLCTSSGGSPEKWKAKIAQFKLSGTHLYVEESVEAELMQLFNGTGFPTYAFINKNGVYKPGSINRMQLTSKEGLIKLIEE